MDEQDTNGSIALFLYGMGMEKKGTKVNIENCYMTWKISKNLLPGIRILSGSFIIHYRSLARDILHYYSP